MVRSSPFAVVCLALLAFADTAHAGDTNDTQTRQIQALNRRVDDLEAGLVKLGLDVDDRMDRQHRRLVASETAISVNAQSAAFRMTAIETSDASQNAAIAKLERELYATEGSGGYSGVLERLGRYSTTLDYTYTRVGKNDQRLGKLEVDVPANQAASQAKLEELGRALHTVQDSFASQHARRDVAFVTGFADGAPTYEVISVSELGAGTDAMFTVDLEPLAGDVSALIDGSAAGTCSQVYKGDVPYEVSGKAVRLCLPLSKTDLYFGREATSTVGTTYINAFDAYEMYTGEKLVFSPYKP